MKSSREILAENLDRLILSYGHTWASIAPDMGYSKAYLYRIRNRELSSGIDKLDEFAAFFGVSAASLLTEKKSGKSK